MDTPFINTVYCRASLESRHVQQLPGAAACRDLPGNVQGRASGGPGAHHVWPGYEAGFIRKDGDGQRFTQLGRFGMVAPWVKDLKKVRSTYNARTETVAEKPSYRNAWSKGQHCVVPAMSFFEPDWRSGISIGRSRPAVMNCCSTPRWRAIQRSPQRPRCRRRQGGAVCRAAVDVQGADGLVRRRPMRGGGERSLHGLQAW